jgi:hypothetical protein
MAPFNIEDTRARLAADLSAGKITRVTHDNYLAIAEFCARQDTYQIVAQKPTPAPTISPADNVRLGGLGRLPISFGSEDTGWWTRLIDLAPVIRVPEESLAQEWERLQPDAHTPADAIEWTTDGGEKVTYRLFSSMAALKAAVDLTPSRDQFVASLRPETRQALRDVGWL